MPWVFDGSITPTNLSGLLLCNNDWNGRVVDMLVNVKDEGTFLVRFKAVYDGRG